MRAGWNCVQLGFGPSSLPPLAYARRAHARRGLTSHVDAEAPHGALAERAARIAVLSALWLSLAVGGGGAPAHATTGMGMDIDLRGEAPSDLGPVAGRQFLKLCYVDACVSSSEEVGSRRYISPWCDFCTSPSPSVCLPACPSVRPSVESRRPRREVRPSVSLSVCLCLSVSPRWQMRDFALFIITIII